jgi:hypothetical protein
VVVGDHKRKYLIANHSVAGNPAKRYEPTRFPEVPLAEASEPTPIPARASECTRIPRGDSLAAGTAWSGGH